MSSPALEAQEQLARAAEAERDWARAGGAWASIATELGKGGDTERAAAAWDAAGECWRRDDRPELADKALRTALALSRDEGQQAIARVKRSGCLAAMGRLDDARSSLHQAMLGPNHAQVVVADGMVDLALAQGDVGLAARWVARLRGEEPLVVATAGFRRAQVARLQGDLETASRELAQAAGALPGLSGQAAVRGEKAEQLEAVGDLPGALKARADAMRLHDEERRWGPWAQALAARVRLAARAGVELATVRSDGEDVRPERAVRQGLVRAGDRQLVLVGLDLAMAHALLARDARALEHVADDAHQRDLHLRAGRILLVGAQAGVLESGVLERAAEWLSGAPLLAHQALHLAGQADSTQWLSQRGLLAED